MHKLAAYALAIATFSTTLLGSISTPKAFACSCVADRSFSEVSKAADLVVLGRVVNHGNSESDTSSMSFQVLEVLSGSEDRSMIRIWAGNGLECRPYASQFEDGKVFVMALGQVPYMDGRTVQQNQTASGEQPPDYAISICGTYWLPVQDGVAIGDVFDSESERNSAREPGEIDRVSLDRIRHLFESPSDYNSSTRLGIRSMTAKEQFLEEIKQAPQELIEAFLNLLRSIEGRSR